LTRLLKIFIPTLSLVFLFGCRTYLIDKESAAKQMTNLKIGISHGVDIDLATGKNYGSTRYSNDLTYLIIKNEVLQYDTISPG
jgi:hypothetical protein